MKTRSPGNSQLSTTHNNTGMQGVVAGNPQQVIGPANGAVAGPGSLQMHHFHPSGALHQKNSMSLGQYETNKVMNFGLESIEYRSRISILGVRGKRDPHNDPNLSALASLGHARHASYLTN